MPEHKIRIAILEDDVDILNYILLLLSKHDEIEVTGTFGDYAAAIKNIGTITVDVMIVDINLPGESGIDFVREAKPLFPAVQFIIYSSLFDTDTIFSALKAGSTGYLTKETPPDKLAGAIKDVYNGGSPMSFDIARKIVKSFHEYEKRPANVLLSQRENEIIHLLAKGLRYKEIADKLFLSTETVRTHIRNIYEKLQVNSRTDAINKYF